MADHDEDFAMRSPPPPEKPSGSTDRAMKDTDEVGE
jgi:hypothetical protein